MLANVLLPAFAAPYFGLLTLPFALVILLVAEFIVLDMLNPSTKRTHIGIAVLLMNLLSTIVGVVIASMLPSGIETITRNGHEVPGMGPDWERYALYGVVLAFVLSLLIEGAFLHWIRRGFELARPLLGCLVANCASYASLIVLAYFS